MLSGHTWALYEPPEVLRRVIEYYGYGSVAELAERDYGFFVKLRDHAIRRHYRFFQERGVGPLKMGAVRDLFCRIWSIGPEQLAAILYRKK